MTLTKTDIMDIIYSQSDVRKTKSAQVVDSLLEIIKNILESDKDVLISGFGKCCVKEKKERKGKGEILSMEII